jgi:hypothetical protein
VVPEKTFYFARFARTRPFLWQFLKENQFHTHENCYLNPSANNESASELEEISNSIGNMNHVQAVTVVEATTALDENNKCVNNQIKPNVTKRSVFKDSNNNVHQQQITKESLNVDSKPTESASDNEVMMEYTLLGFIKFKSPIKWLNTVSIILIHLIFIYAFFTYPLQGCFITTMWGKCCVVCHEL